MATSSSSAGKKRMNPQTVKDTMITNKITKNGKELQQSVSMTTSNKATLTVTTALGNNNLLTLMKSTLKFNVDALSDYNFNEELPDEIKNLLQGELTIGKDSDSVKLEQKNFEELVLTVKTGKGKDSPALVCMINADGVFFKYNGETYTGINKEASSDNKKFAGNSFQMTTAFFEHIAPKYQTLSDIPPFLIGEYFSLTTKALNAEAPFTKKEIGNYTFIGYSYEKQNYAFVIDKQKHKYYLYHDGKCAEIKNYNLNKIGFAGLSLYSHNEEVFLVANVGSGKSSKSIKLALPKEKDLCTHLLGALDENFNINNSGVFSKETDQPADKPFEDNGYDAINFNGYVAYTAAPNNLTNYSFAIKSRKKNQQKQKPEADNNLTVILNMLRALDVKHFKKTTLKEIRAKKEELREKLESIILNNEGLLQFISSLPKVLDQQTRLLQEIRDELPNLGSSGLDLTEFARNMAELNNSINTLSELIRSNPGDKEIYKEIENNGTRLNRLISIVERYKDERDYQPILRPILERLNALNNINHMLLDGKTALVNIRESVDKGNLEMAGLRDQISELFVHLRAIDSKFETLNETGLTTQEKLSAIVEILHEDKDEEILNAVNDIQSTLSALPAGATEETLQKILVENTEMKNSINRLASIVERLAERESPDESEDEETEEDRGTGEATPTDDGTRDADERTTGVADDGTRDADDRTATADRDLATGDGTATATATSGTTDGGKAETTSKTSEKTENKKEDKDLSPWEHKLNTTFWGTTMMPLVAFFALIACALTGIGALAVVAIAAVAVSGTLIAIDQSKLSVNRSIKNLRDNKYSKFRTLDNECEKGKQKYHEKTAEMETFVATAEDEDFSKKFLNYYSDYGISKETFNYAERYAQSMGREPDEETLQKFTEFNMISDPSERKAKINDYLATLSDEDRTKVETAFARSPFLDAEHSSIQHEACNAMREIENESAVDRRSELEDKFISTFLPDVEDSVRSEFLKEFQIVSVYSDRDAGIDDLIGKYFPATLSDTDKTILRNQLSDIMASEDRASIKEKGITVGSFADDHSNMMRDKRISEIKSELFEGTAKIESMTEFRKKLEPYQASAMEYLTQKEDLDRHVQDMDYFAIVQIFRAETDNTRKRALFDRYSDIITRKMLAQNKNPIVIIDEVLKHLPDDMRDYAASKIQYQASKLDKATALLHKDVFKSVKKTQELEQIKAYAKAIFDATELASTTTNFDDFENLTKIVHDSLLKQECQNLAKTKDSLLGYRSHITETSTTLGSFTRNITTSDEVKDNLVAYHTAIDKSGILEEIWDEYSATGKMSKTDQGKSVSEIINQRIKEAYISQIIKFEMQKSKEEDFDKRVVNETNRRKELEKKSLDEIVAEISTSYPDFDKFCTGDKRLKGYKDVVDKHKALQESIDSRASFVNLATILVDRSLSVDSKISFTGGTVTFRDEFIAYARNFDNAHKKNGISLKIYMEKLFAKSEAEAKAFAKLIYQEIISKKNYDSLTTKPRVPRNNKDYQRYQIINKIVVGKVTGKLSQDLISEASLRNIQKISRDKDLKDASIKFNSSDSVEKFENLSIPFEEKIENSKPIQDIIATLPQDIRAEVRKKMIEKRARYASLSTSQILNSALKEVAGEQKLATNKTIKEELTSRGVSDSLNINEVRLRTIIEKIDIEKSTVRKDANRVYSTREGVLSKAIVEDEVQITRNALTKRIFKVEELDSSILLSAEEKEALEIRDEIEQAESNLKYLENLKNLSPGNYEAFAQDLEKLTQLDESMIEKFGLKEDFENAILKMKMLVGLGDLSAEDLATLEMTKEQVKEVRQRFKNFKAKRKLEDRKNYTKKLALSQKDLSNIRQVLSLLGKGSLDSAMISKLSALGLSEDQIKKLQERLTFYDFPSSGADFMKNTIFQDISSFVKEYQKSKPYLSADELCNKLKAFWEEKSKNIKDSYEEKIKSDKKELAKKQSHIKEKNESKERRSGLFRRLARAIAKSDIDDKKLGSIFAGSAYNKEIENEDKRIKAEIGKEDEK